LLPARALTADGSRSDEWKKSLTFRPRTVEVAAPSIDSPNGLTWRMCPSESVVRRPVWMLLTMISFVSRRSATSSVASRSFCPAWRRLSEKYDPMRATVPQATAVTNTEKRRTLVGSQGTSVRPCAGTKPTRTAQSVAA
jgi:hypothetical protein